MLRHICLKKGFNICNYVIVGNIDCDAKLMYGWSGKLCWRTNSTLLLGLMLHLKGSFWNKGCCKDVLVTKIPGCWSSSM